MCLCTTKRKIRVESVTASASRQRGELTSAQFAGRAPPPPSAGISLKGIQGGLQRCLVATPSAAQIWLTNADFGSTSAMKNNQPADSPLTNSQSAPRRAAPRPKGKSAQTPQINTAKLCMQTHGLPPFCRQQVMRTNYHLHLQQQLLLPDSQNTYSRDLT